TVIDAPISEELFKGLALLILIFTQRHKIDSLTDFLIYACAVGIGFELVENILYQWSTLDQDNQVAGWLDEFNNRILASAGSHAFYSVWLGLAGWILFQTHSRTVRVLAPAAISLSMLLHSLNNLTVVMSQAGPEDVVLPINRLGITLSVVSNHLTLALFIGLIGVAILRDVRFLIDFGSLIQTRLLRHSETFPSQSLLILKDLTNPINHVIASSGWSWRWSQHVGKHLIQRSAYREFAKLALASAQRGPAASTEALARSGCIDQGLKLIKGLA
ncbi:MAG: PrsW family intramembrane metalloprotease, partial [Cyanobacteria bacterium K_Offshore_0m_m2_072]|nr:PrsW family intramembrane metalloprotease [Cyanobacteria bacterium K_Offshore_0m_m2_072]